jgi:L-rhamnose-H+ transport protein
MLSRSALFLVISAGLMQGSFVFPMKYTSKWEWENTWLVFCLLGFIVLPFALVLLTVPHPELVLASSSPRTLFHTALFGLGWGCGSVCFGLGIKALGMGLGYSIILGLTGGLGSLIPWFSAPGKSLNYSLLLWCGVLAMLAGVVVCSLAGRERERKAGAHATPSAPRREFVFGLALCVASGILSCFMNLGFAYGSEITLRAQALGANATAAPNVLWLIILSAGFVANASYCVYLLVTKRSWRRYGLPETPLYLGGALVMGLLWVGSLMAYGVGANRIGRLGPSVGWPILMSLCIVVSNVWGVATGEWRGTGRKPLGTMALGLGILLVAVVILGFASMEAQSRLCWFELYVGRGAKLG